MSRAEFPPGTRLGCVPYLNARPLVDGAGVPVDFAVPSALAPRFARGEFDAALLPAFDVLAGAGGAVADGACIASKGDVFSVFVASRSPLADTERIFLDPASLTSSHLLRVLLAEFLDWDGELAAGAPGPDDARLMIGDPAISFRRARPAAEWQFFDLGGAWFEFTGLPFVFACWALRDALRDPSAVAAALRACRERGISRLDAIAASDPDPEFARLYFTRHIRYLLGDDEKRAMHLFAALLRKHGLARQIPDPILRFV